MIKKEMGHFEEALSAFNRCLAINPKKAEVYWNRADLYSEVTCSDIEKMKALLSEKNSDQKRVFGYFFPENLFEMIQI